MLIANASDHAAHVLGGGERLDDLPALVVEVAVGHEGDADVSHLDVAAKLLDDGHEVGLGRVDPRSHRARAVHADAQVDDHLRLGRERAQAPGAVLAVGGRRRPHGAEAVHEERAQPRVGLEGLDRVRELGALGRGRVGGEVAAEEEDVRVAGRKGVGLRLHLALIVPFLLVCRCRRRESVRPVAREKRRRTALERRRGRLPRGRARGLDELDEGVEGGVRGHGDHLVVDGKGGEALRFQHEEGREEPRLERLVATGANEREDGRVGELRHVIVCALELAEHVDRGLADLGLGVLGGLDGLLDALGEELERLVVLELLVVPVNDGSTKVVQVGDRGERRVLRLGPPARGHLIGHDGRLILGERALGRLLELDRGSILHAEERLDQVPALGEPPVQPRAQLTVLGRLRARVEVQLGGDGLAEQLGDGVGLGHLPFVGLGAEGRARTLGHAAAAARRALGRRRRRRAAVPTAVRRVLAGRRRQEGLVEGHLVVIGLHLVGEECRDRLHDGLGRLGLLLGRGAGERLGEHEEVAPRAVQRDER
mmetsp:Transcript_17355/g.36257  ORF Transcript_17355/g.36257 Transcript_17355/m.36257 type:complete len:540 (+) Transcript_17355:1284-2903(+)